MDDIFTSFSTKEHRSSDDRPEGGFEPLAPGDYKMRVIAFSRSTSKAGNPQIVLRLKAIGRVSKAGFDTSGCHGTALWYITVTRRAKNFVLAAILAANNGEDWDGNLASDDDVKGLFLGKLVLCTISNRSFNGKTFERVEGVSQAPKSWLEDDEHHSSSDYWGAATFRNSSSSSSGGGGNGDSSKVTESFDDDIPF